MTEVSSCLEKFTAEARAAAATVQHVENYDEAFAYVYSLFKDKNSDNPQAEKGIAAPGLTPELWDKLYAMGTSQGIRCISSGLRNFPHDISVGLSIAHIGLAETGTIVLNCPREDNRLCSMISDYHVCLLSLTDIVADSSSAVKKLERFMRTSPDYTAFITGPSRTADIERVLTIGVHGPLELHILIHRGR